MIETGSTSPGLGKIENGEYSITLSGTKTEINQVRQMMNGMVWLTKNANNKTEVTDRFKSLPEPIDDPFVPPQWQSDAGLGDIPAKWAPEIRDFVPEGYGWAMPHFYMSHIMNPKSSIPKLQDWGFECMRSRRGEDGKFWETWYLPGDWAAKGDLKRFIDSLTIPGIQAKDMAWEMKTKAICEWLSRRVVFGTLDVSIQRMALASPD